jgi:hypothetical protein
MPVDQRSDNQVFVHDAATGEHLWTLAVPMPPEPRGRGVFDPRERFAARLDPGPPSARLVDGGSRIVAQDGEDAAAYATRPDAGGRPAELWRIAGMGRLVAELRDLGSVLWLPGPALHPGFLIETATGAVVARVHADAADAPIRSGDLLLLPVAGRQVRAIDLGLGRTRWQTGASRILAVNDADVVVIAEDGGVAVLDRANGTQRRRLDWTRPQALPVSGPDAACGLLLRSATDMRLAVADAASGSLRVAVALPPAGEVSAAQAHPDGLAALLRHPDGGRVLIDLGRDGAVRSLVPLPGFAAGAGVVAVPGGHLVLSNLGLMAQPLTLPATPEPWPATALPAGGLDDAAHVSGQALWQAVPGGRVALAMSGNRVLVLAALTADSDALALRLGDVGPVCDDGRSIALDVVRRDRALVCLQATARLEPDWRWRITGTALAGDVLAILVEAAPDRDPLARLAVGIDGDAMPWWIRAVWRQARPTP